jgi:hypothetical protein
MDMATANQGKNTESKKPAKFGGKKGPANKIGNKTKKGPKC